MTRLLPAAVSMLPDVKVSDSKARPIVTPGIHLCPARHRQALGKERISVDWDSDKLQSLIQRREAGRSPLNLARLGV